MLFWIIIFFNSDTIINLIDNFFSIDDILEDHGTNGKKGYKEEILER